MRSTFWKNEEGSVIVIVAIIFTVLLGCIGLSLDVGNLYLVRTRMQNAVDAAVCGGGLSLPNTGLATSQAKSFITSNGFNSANATITFTQDAVSNPQNHPEINGSLTNNVPTYFMGLFGFKSVLIKTMAEVIMVCHGEIGPFNYALFSNLPLGLSGSRDIEGSVHSNESLVFSGSKNIITGAAEGVTGVTISGSSQSIGSVAAGSGTKITMSGSGDTIGPETYNAVNICMPDFTSQIEAIANSEGTVYSGSKTYSGTTNINGDIYVNGSVTISGTLNGTGCILASGGITISGNTTISGSNQVCIYSATGGISFSGTSTINTGTNASAILYAPEGTVSSSGSLSINGSIVANQITISGGLNVDSTGFPNTTLPCKPHAKLIS